MVIKTFKILNGYYDKDVCDFLCPHWDVMPNRNQVRGNTKKMFKRRPRLDVRKYSCSYRIVEYWNRISEEVIVAPTIKTFERSPVHSDPFFGTPLSIENDFPLIAANNQVNCRGKTSKVYITFIYKICREAGVSWEQSRNITLHGRWFLKMQYLLFSI